MATTRESIARPLADFGSDTIEWVSAHSWVAVDRHGVERTHLFDLGHADRRCPAATTDANGIEGGAPWHDSDELPWPCAECFTSSPSGRPYGPPVAEDSLQRGGQGLGASRAAEPATEAQQRLLMALCRAAALRADAASDLTAERLEFLARANADEALAGGKRAASLAIDATKAQGLAPVWTPLTEHDPRAQVERQPEAGLRTNRYASSCAACGAQVPAEGGWLTRGARGWEVRHQGACPAPAAAPAPQGDGYEPAKGDVHMIDGTYYRVHVSQTSGFPYGAVWNGAKFVGGSQDDRAKGSLRRMSRATLATAEQAAAFGHMHHRCCFCSTPIDTPESEAVGYGPKCAADRGLPWG